MRVINQNLKLTNPLADYPYYVLIETSGSNGDHDQEKLTSFLEFAIEEGLVSDGTIATEVSKIKVSCNVSVIQIKTMSCSTCRLIDMVALGPLSACSICIKTAVHRALN